MPTLHFVSHTHWDREWYEPFQIFRIRLAQTIDKALGILASDPNYRYFMLDGQTIVLEDYLEMEPEREAELRAHIASGRVLIGPWYILPDEFLVSGEAIIRNLMRGIRIANSFGKCMMIGYIPDPFGHISQMPQILEGFGIHHAMFRRGLADEPTELWWEGADHTRVFTTYLRDGYDNAAWLARDPEQFARGVKRLVDSLLPFAVTENLLMMHGTDHMAPWENLPEVMHEAERTIPDTRFIHSNLPDYAQAVEGALASVVNQKLEVVKGELRNPKRHHLLPGVTSTRMWIKQRNALAQTLLERWAEPLAAFALLLPVDSGGLVPELRQELDLAWKYLLQNHPHDSICGCSADQVHLEMAPRFDWVEQIGGDISKRSAEIILRSIDTRNPDGSPAIVVLNPTPGPRTDLVKLQLDLPSGFTTFRVVNGDGNAMPCLESSRHVDEYAHVTATADDLRWMFGGIKAGHVNGHNVREISFQVQDREVYADVSISDEGEPDPAHLEGKLAELDRLVADTRGSTFHVRVHSLERAEVTFLARDVPGYGYKTFWLQAGPPVDQQTVGSTWTRIENEFLIAEPSLEDGTLTITDKTTGAIYAGTNRFVDGGDRGDLYNHCPPEQDRLVTVPCSAPTIRVSELNSVRQVLTIESTLRVPAELTPDRRARSQEMVDLPITTQVTLATGARRVDFRTEVRNTARDHRLRVEFATTIRTDKSMAAQAFDIVTRDTDLPSASKEWVERPVATKPMQEFVAIEDGRIGLIMAARGLPEYEVINDKAAKQPESTLALTLLRCVGWLSRPDMSCRRGDAGPEKQTPGAQEPGTHIFDYSLIPYAARSASYDQTIDPSAVTFGWQGAEQEALSFAAPLRSVIASSHAGALPSSANLIQVSPAGFLLTAVKPPEKGDGLIVRGFNATDEPIKVQLRPLLRFSHATRVNLNEEGTEPIAWTEPEAVELEAKPREIVTVKFER